MSAPTVSPGSTSVTVDDIKIEGWIGEESLEFTCGHRTTRFRIDIYGEVLTPNETFFAKLVRCGDCEVEHLKKVTTRCVACRKAILPGAQVAIYTVGIGCMRRDCSGYSGAGALAGHWDGTGVKSLFEPGQ